MATTFLKPKNNGTTTLNGALDISQTDVAVVDSSVFPTTYPFHVTCEDEIMEVNNNNTGTNTLTVETRDTIESTSAATHANATSIRLLITAEAMTEIHTAVNALENQKLNEVPTPDGAVDFDLQQATDMVVMTVANEAALPTTGIAKGQLCWATAEGTLHICTSAS